MTRVVDVVIAGLGLLVLSPALVVIGVVVRLTSRGPALFRQARVGLHGQPFQILKFRTMMDANGGGPAGPLVTSGDDPRITRVGGVLRASKLDELPQLVNVLKGDMSLVGPRPEVAEYAAWWTATQREVILSVRPGITDPASLRFRNESELLAQHSDPERFYIEHLIPAKAALYVSYVQGRTLRTDLRLLVTTVVSVIRR